MTAENLVLVLLVLGLIGLTACLAWPKDNEKRGNTTDHEHH